MTRGEQCAFGEHRSTVSSTQLQPCGRILDQPLREALGGGEPAQQVDLHPLQLDAPPRIRALLAGRELRRDHFAQQVACGAQLSVDLSRPGVVTGDQAPQARFHQDGHRHRRHRAHGVLCAKIRGFVAAGTTVMEIEIDWPTVRSIIDAEQTLTTAHIQQLGPIAACEQSQSRHDQRLAAASDTGTLACKAGCFWCCFFSVDVRAVEVFRILQFMEQQLVPRERERIQQQIQTNLQLLGGGDEESRTRQNIRCPFLDQGRCVIYSARPQTCRNYHATDVAGCRLSYEQPDNEDIDPEFAPLTYQIGAAHVDGFSKAMADAGYDTSVFEMNAALAQALAEPGAQQRFEAGKPPFIALRGLPVPLEFEEE